MNQREMFKRLLLLAIIVASVFYVASSFFVAKSVADIFRPSDMNAVRLVVAPHESATDKAHIDNRGVVNASGDEKRTDVRIIAEPIQRQGTGFRFQVIVSMIIQTLVFLVLLFIPCWIFYNFLFKPLSEFPVVTPSDLENLRSDRSVLKERAAATIAKAMLASVTRELSRVDESDSRFVELKNDEERLDEALRKSIGGARVVLEMLEQREGRAKAIALEFASMAGLTVALSSSTMGDGLGMLFWKARLVHDTIRIYGFRPDAWAVLRIYAYVMFAAFLAAGVEDLCELLDVSELLGGFGARALQGCVGGAIVIKGGYLARAYLTQGVSRKSQKSGLEESKKAKKDDLKHLGAALMSSLARIGGFRQTAEPVEPVI